MGEDRLPCFFGDIDKKAPFLTNVWKDTQNKKGVIFFVGPETGFSEKEEEKLKNFRFNRRKTARKHFAHGHSCYYSFGGGVASAEHGQNGQNIMDKFIMDKGIMDKVDIDENLDFLVHLFCPFCFVYYVLSIFGHFLK